MVRAALAKRDALEVKSVQCLSGSKAGLHNWELRKVSTISNSDCNKLKAIAPVKQRRWREPCKNPENAVNTNTFWTRDAQNTANIIVFESKAKKHCKLQHFWRVDRKKCWYLQCFCNFKKTWKARNTANSGVLATFGRRNAGIYAVFCRWRRQTTVNYIIFYTVWTDFFVSMNAKNTSIYAFFIVFQKIEDRDLNETL